MLPFNKKASLDISIKVIVTFVLSMIFLGLGLGFIRGVFKNIGSTADQVLETSEKQILDDLIKDDKKVSFYKDEIQIDKGASDILSIGVRNKEDGILRYKINFIAVSDPDGNPFSINSPKWFQFDEKRDYPLNPSESDIRKIRLTVPMAAAIKSGSYTITLEIINSDGAAQNNIYWQKNFFVVVR